MAGPAPCPGLMRQTAFGLCEKESEEVPENSIYVSSLFEPDALKERAHPQLLAFLNGARYPWELLGASLNAFVLECIQNVPEAQRRRGHIHPAAVLEGTNIVVEEGATIEAGAYITGPTYICSGAAVRHGAYVRGDVYLSSGAVIGHTTEAKGALLLPDAKAAHFAYVGNSVLGADCNLGAGTKLANLRFDHGPVNIRLGAERYETGLKKCGAMMGNRSQTGCNAVTNPGTIFLPGAFLRPTVCGSGLISSKLPVRQGAHGANT